MFIMDVWTEMKMVRVFGLQMVSIIYSEEIPPQDNPKRYGA